MVYIWLDSISFQPVRDKFVMITVYIVFFVRSEHHSTTIGQFGKIQFIIKQKQ